MAQEETGKKVSRTVSALCQAGGRCCREKFYIGVVQCLIWEIVSVTADVISLETHRQTNTEMTRVSYDLILGTKKAIGTSVLFGGADSAENCSSWHKAPTQRCFYGDERRM